MLYDALQDMIPAAKLKRIYGTECDSNCPLAFMRGRTLNDAGDIGRGSKIPPQQIKCSLTRMGMNTKMIVTGDMTQIDLPSSQTGIDTSTKNSERRERSVSSNSTRRTLYGTNWLPALWKHTRSLKKNRKPFIHAILDEVKNLKT